VQSHGVNVDADAFAAPSGTRYQTRGGVAVLVRDNTATTTVAITVVVTTVVVVDSAVAAGASA
jgi:hypothetical protein